MVNCFEFEPFQLLSWWDMEIFFAEELYRVARLLEVLSSPVCGREDLEKVGSADVAASFRKLGLNFSLKHLERLLESARSAIDEKRQSDELLWVVRELQQRVQDELSERFFLYIPPEDAGFYKNADGSLAGPVLDKWPRLAEDSSEASKCFALGRHTACVFHLMRVMEFGVQQFGRKLGVKLSEEKRWQTILDQTNSIIKGMDQKLPETKALSSVASNLYHVKAAWRNEVMHPKGTYTREESFALIGAVKAFITELAIVS